MFLQIHMLQSMPPGNPNRDDVGQPKKCIFGRVTRGRISSQCLKRNIRTYFKSAFGDALAVRTQYLPRMVADELRKLHAGISEDELNQIKAALARKFKAENRAEPEGGEEAEEKGSAQREATPPSPDQTGQLVFFPPPFAKKIAELIASLRKSRSDGYRHWLGAKESKSFSKEEKKTLQKQVEKFEGDVSELSKSLTVDIGMFGRMTTSDLVVNVEAACQVAHAISTHEAIIESDWFSAMDDKKADFASTQTELAGAAFIGSGESETFFDSAVYYKYLNLDIDALSKHLSWDDDKASHAAGVLLEAAARANPTGKQNAFANHGVHELILVELSEQKFPISYANAFLKPVEGPNLMTESAKALAWYISSVAKAFSPPDTRRTLLAVGSAADVKIEDATRVETLDALVASVARLTSRKGAAV